MRRTILFSLFALLALNAASDAYAQRRGGGGSRFVRGGYARSRARHFSPNGFGYSYLPYDSGSDYGAGYDYAPQPAPFVQPPPQQLVEAPAPVVKPPSYYPPFTEYTWTAAELASSPSTPSRTSEPEPETEPFAIVLKNGSTLSAVAVFASDDGLHFVDPDEKHLRISMSEVDRGATLKLNRARNLNLHLPAQ